MSDFDDLDDIAEQMAAGQNVGTRTTCPGRGRKWGHNSSPNWRYQLKAAQRRSQSISVSDHPSAVDAGADEAVRTRGTDHNADPVRKARGSIGGAA